MKPAWFIIALAIILGYVAGAKWPGIWNSVAAKLPGGG